MRNGRFHPPNGGCVTILINLWRVCRAAAELPTCRKGVMTPKLPLSCPECGLQSAKSFQIIIRMRSDVEVDIDTTRAAVARSTQLIMLTRRECEEIAQYVQRTSDAVARSQRSWPEAAGYRKWRRSGASALWVQSIDRQTIRCAGRAGYNMGLPASCVCGAAGSKSWMLDVM